MIIERWLRSEVFGVDGSNGVGGTGFPVASESYLLDADVPDHSHDFLELGVVVAGRGRYGHGVTGRGRPDRSEQDVELKPGQLVAVRPGQWHGYTRCENLHVVNLYLGPELLRRELVWLLDSPRLAPLLLRGGMLAEPVRPDRIAAMMHWLEAVAEHGPDSAVGLGLACCALAEIEAGTAGEQRRPVSPVVVRAVQLLGERPERAWQTPTLAARVGVSVPHLHRLFTTEIGTTPMRWLTQLRVERAAGLLIRTNVPVPPSDAVINNAA